MQQYEELTVLNEYFLIFGYLTVRICVYYCAYYCVYDRARLEFEMRNYPPATIVNKHGTPKWYACGTVPQHLQKVLGKKQVYRSLRTTDRQDAKRRLVDAQNKIHEEFFAAETNQEPLVAAYISYEEAYHDKPFDQISMNERFDPRVWLRTSNTEGILLELMTEYQRRAELWHGQRQTAKQLGEEWPIVRPSSVEMLNFLLEYEKRHGGLVPDTMSIEHEALSRAKGVGVSLHNLRAKVNGTKPVVTTREYLSFNDVAEEYLSSTVFTTAAKGKAKSYAAMRVTRTGVLPTWPTTTLPGSFNFSQRRETSPGRAKNLGVFEGENLRR